MDVVYRFSVSLTRNRADADNLVQDTYLRAHGSWRTFARDGDVRRWLLTICHTGFIQGRERARYRAEGANADERLQIRLDSGPAICEALDRLTEPYRSVVFLVDLEHQAYEAAAAILGVPIDTVRSRLFSARRQLRRMLDMHARDAGCAPCIDPTMV
jgi:RNA polymerase sigma-70 factor (ECF subfamily)